MNRLKKLLCSFCAALLLLNLLAGCRSSGSRPIRPPEERPVATGTAAPENRPKPLPTHCPEPELVGKTVSVTPVTPDGEALNRFAESLSALQITYDTLDDLFDLQSARQFFGENLRPVPKHRLSGLIQNGKVDQQALLHLVEKNNAAFVPTEHPGALFYKAPKDPKLLKRTIALLAEGIEAELPYQSAEEIAELNCVLGDLCIFESTGLSGAAVTMENILTINQQMIKMMAINAGVEDGFRHTVIHESKHLLQASCNENNAAPAQWLGISLRADKLERNPYFWTWFLEAAAERNTACQLEEKPQTYIRLIGYLETLDLAGLLSEHTVTGFELDKLALTRNRDEVFRILGQGAGIREDELVQMMLAMEVLQKRVEDYPAYYQQAYGRELSDEAFTEIRLNLRRQFLLTATKIYYLNLTQALRSAEAPTLEDVFYLLSLWEADLNYHLDYIDRTTDPKTVEFLQTCHRIQQDFFAALSASGTLTATEISEKYGSYRPFAAEDGQTPAPHCRMRWLSAEKQARLLEKATGEQVRFAPALPLLLSEKDA